VAEFILLSHLRVRPSCSAGSASSRLSILQQVSTQRISTPNPMPCSGKGNWVYLNHLGGKELQQHASAALKRIGDQQKFSNLGFSFHHCYHIGQHSVQC